MNLEWPMVAMPVSEASVPDAPRAAAPGTSGRDFREVLEALGRELDRGEALLGRATRGGAGRLDTAQLIALQAGIYRYTEAVELTARFVDRAQNAVRTTLQSGAG